MVTSSTSSKRVATPCISSPKSEKAADKVSFMSVVTALKSSRLCVLLGAGAAVFSWEERERLGLLLAEHVECCMEEVTLLCMVRNNSTILLLSCMSVFLGERERDPEVFQSGFFMFSVG